VLILACLFRLSPIPYERIPLDLDKLVSALFDKECLYWSRIEINAFRRGESQFSYTASRLYLSLGIAFAESRPQKPEVQHRPSRKRRKYDSKRGFGNRWTLKINNSLRRQG
jgi:hypothetical protein